MENEKPINFALEKIKRSYLPDFIKNFKEELLKGDFDGDDAELANSYLCQAEEAIEDLKNGNIDKAKKILDFDIQRMESWKKFFIDRMRNQERISEAQIKIERLKKLREELETP